MPHLAGRPRKAGRVTPGLDAIDGGSRLLELSGRPLNRALVVILDGAAVAQRIGQVCHPTDEVAWFFAPSASSVIRSLIEHPFVNVTLATPVFAVPTKIVPR